MFIKEPEPELVDKRLIAPELEPELVNEYLIAPELEPELVLFYSGSPALLLTIPMHKISISSKQPLFFDWQEILPIAFKNMDLSFE